VPPLRSVATELYASHHQFYVADGEYAGDDPDFWAGAAAGGELWDGAALERHFDAVDGMLAVGTVAYGVVPVTVEIWDAEPPADLDAWDHVVEASLDTPSARLVLGSVDGWERGSGELTVARGTNRVRVSAAGLEGATELGGDSYRVQLWPGPMREPHVAQWWPPWQPARAAGRPSGGGRLLVGAAAHDARVDMHWLASRGEAHLFSDENDVLWEHTTLHDASGTPQLEELPPDEAERRFGPRTGWEQRSLDPSVRGVLRALWQSSRRRRPGR
jgi:hypothetical protein